MQSVVEYFTAGEPILRTRKLSDSAPAGEWIVTRLSPYTSRHVRGITSSSPRAQSLPSTASTMTIIRMAPSSPLGP